jgi:hypothetical protein
LTSTLYILHPIRSAYASLCIRNQKGLTKTGSTSVAGLSAQDLGDVGKEDELIRNVSAWVGMARKGRQVDVAFTNAGKEHRESVIYEPPQKSWEDY